MSTHDLNLLVIGWATGAYVVLVIWSVIAFWDDLRTLIPARKKA